MAKRRGNKEGSIYQRTNGTWRAQVTIGGKRLSFTGSTQKECRKWIRDTARRIENGLNFEGATIQYSEFLENWLASIQHSLRDATWRQYCQLVRDYVIPTLGGTRLMELHPANIQALYDKLIRAGKGLRTVQMVHIVIHRSLKQAVKVGILNRNPDEATNPPKPKRREMEFLDEAQVQKLLIAAEQSQQRHLALYQLAVSSGMRQGELLGLKWSDISWVNHQIQIKRQLKRLPKNGFEFAPPKTKSGVRTIAVGEQIISGLQKHRKLISAEMHSWSDDVEDHDLVFPNPQGHPTNSRYLLTQFKQLLREANLPILRFHDLRHTAATLMLNKGIPVLVVARRLGHAKPSITLDIYGHLVPSMQTQAAELMDEVITPIRVQFKQKTAPELHQESDDFDR